MVKDQEQIMMEKITRVVEERINEATKCFIGQKNNVRTQEAMAQVVKNILLEFDNHGQDFIINMDNGDRLKLDSVDSMYNEDTGKISLYYHWRVIR